MVNFIRNFINKIENSDQSILFHFFSFLAIITLRNLIECFSDHTPILAMRFFHYYLSYAVLALNIIILLHCFTKEEVKKLTRIVLSAYIFILLGPLLDLAISLGQGFNISYFLPGIHKNLLSKFLTFFGDYRSSGVTPGIRIEIAIILIATFVYVRFKTTSYIKSFFSVLTLYSLLFFYFCLPIIINFFLQLTGFNFKYSDILMTYIYLLLFVVFLIVFYLVENRDLLKNILKDIRPYRILHFQLMFVAGILLFPLKISEIFIDAKDILAMVVALLAILFACLVAIIINNISDKRTDKANKRENILLKKKMDLTQYKIFALFSILLMALYALAVDFIFFFLLLCFAGNYYLYSMPPFRFKKLLFFSKFIISLNSVILAIAGFIFAGGNFFEFPHNLTFYFIVILAFPLQFIDIKDYVGDKEEGIKTLPVVMGLVPSKIFIGISFLLAYIMMPFILRLPQILPVAVAAGAVQVFLINKKNYREKWVFIWYLSGLVAFFFYILHLKGKGIEILIHKLLY